MTGCNTNNSPPPQQQNSIDPISLSSPFHHLCLDCIHIILHYHIFHLHNGNKCNAPDNSPLSNDVPGISIHAGGWLYDLESHDTVNTDWNFLRRFAHCCHFYGDAGLKKFLSNCRDWECKPTFSYLGTDSVSLAHLYESGAVEYLRGIPELDLELIVPENQDCRECLDSLTLNIRGVKKLTVACHENNHIHDMGPFTVQHLENLRGIQQAQFLCCDFTTISSENAFQNLRGIKSLTLCGCSFHRDFMMLPNLRGIQELNIESSLHNLQKENFENIRGVRRFSFECHQDADVGLFSLRDSHLQQLRGIQELEIYEVQKELDEIATLPSLTDQAFKNLRGAKIVVLKNVLGKNLTEFADDELRGAEKIDVDKIFVFRSTQQMRW